MTFQKSLPNKFDCNIDCFPVKSTYQIYFLNLYAKSSIFKKCCIDCSPNSTIYFDAKNKSNYLIDLLEFRDRKIVNKSTAKPNFKNIASFALQNDKLNEFIDNNLKCVKNESETISNHAIKSKFLKAIHEKLSSICLAIDPYNTPYENLTFKTFKFCLRFIFDKIICSQIHLSALETATRKHLPVVYVSNSDATCLDHLLIKLTLFLNYFQLPYLFTQINEKKSWFLRIIAKLFKFKYFDETNLKNTKNNQLNGTNLNDEPIFYKQALAAYLIEYFKNENYMIVKNNTDLIDFLVELIEHEQLHDIIIVPVGVYYEKTLDCYSAWKAIKSLFSCPLFGQSRINFSQPFSLKEYLETMKTKFKQTNSLTNSISLKKHISYDAFQMNSIMCTNIIAFILLNQYSCGCLYRNLCLKFDEIKTDLGINYQISFRYDSIENIIDYSIELLQEYLIITEVEKNCYKTRNYHIKPKKDINSVDVLFKLSKNVTQCYFMNSILAYSIKISLNTDFYHLNMTSTNSMPTLNENDLIYNSFQLIKMFQNEFEPYKKPCESVFSKVFQTINLFINNDFLIDQTNNFNKKTSYRNNQLSFDEDEENDDEFIHSIRNVIEHDISNINDNFSNHKQDPDCKEINNWMPSRQPKLFKLKIDSKNVSSLIQYTKILSLHLEVYLGFFSFLKELDRNITYSEREFFQMLKEHSLNTIKTKQINLSESTLKGLHLNALDYSINMKFIKKSYSNDSCFSFQLIENNEMNKVYSLLRKL